MFITMRCPSHKSAWEQQTRNAQLSEEDRAHTRCVGYFSHRGVRILDKWLISAHSGRKRHSENRKRRCVIPIPGRKLRKMKAGSQLTFYRACVRVSVYVCACMLAVCVVCIHMYSCVLTYVHVDAESKSWVSLSLTTLLCEPSSLPEPGAHWLSWAGCPVNSGDLPASLPSDGVVNGLHYTWLFTWCSTPAHPPFSCLFSAHG